MTARLDGYDIYHGNAIVNIDAIPSFPVVAHKACEGASSVDPLCAARLPKLKARIKLIYLWLRPDATADAQVANLQRQVKACGLLDARGRIRPGFAVMLDWEKTYDSHGNGLPMPTRELVDRTHDLIHGLYPDRLITYSAPWVAHFHEWRAANPDAPFWLADYTVYSVEDARALGATVTQFTNHAVIPGFEKPVDGNQILRPDVLDRIAGLNHQPAPIFPYVPQEDEMRLLTNGEPRDIGDGHGPWDPGFVIYKLHDDDTAEHVVRSSVSNARGGTAAAQKVSNVDLDDLGAV